MRFVKLCPVMIQVVAIDGISGSGKSSTARLLARSLGFRHLDTGAMYRMLTHAALLKGIASANHRELGRIAQSLEFSFDKDGGLLADGKTLPIAIRSAEVSGAVSEYCKSPEVRTVLVAQQRKLGLQAPCVMEGRDIATVVFPDAPWKFFMTARPEVRADRRTRELIAAGLPANREEILQNLRERDTKDSSRAVSPLKKAPDAVELDTSDLTLEAQVAILSDLVRKSPA